MAQRIIIVGNSITAEILYKYIQNDTRYEVVGFCVDAQYITEERFFDVDIIPIENILISFPTTHHKIILAMGYKNINQDREIMFNRMKTLGYTIETYIHPDAKIYNDEIGEGSIVLPNSVIEPFSKIGKNSFIWANCTIGHHATIQDHCWIASGSVVAGEAKVFSNTFLGVGSTIVNQVTVEKSNIIGAHVLVSKNTKSEAVYLARSGEKHRFSSFDYANFFIK